MTTNASTKPKRRFLRFSLRTLLFLMLVICVMLGWKIGRARKQRQAVAWVQQSGGNVQYDDWFDPFQDSQPTVPKWLRKQLGRDFFDEVVQVTFDHNSNQVNDVTPLAGLTSLRELSLHGTQVTDVTPLARLTRLEWLDLDGTQVNDVTPLAALTSLRELDLYGTQVKDVTPLAGLTSLCELNLNSTQVKDVTPLAGLTHLKPLHLHRTRVGKEDHNGLRKVLSNTTTIETDQSP